MKNTLNNFFAVTALLLALSTPVSAQANEELSNQFSHTVAYIAEHGVSVVSSSDGGSLIILETSFQTSDDTELHILLGKDGIFAPEADLGKLSHINGLQVFRTPATINISGFNEIHLWNPEYGVVVGVTPLG